MRASGDKWEPYGASSGDSWKQYGEQSTVGAVHGGYWLGGFIEASKVLKAR